MSFLTAWLARKFLKGGGRPSDGAASLVGKGDSFCSPAIQDTLSAIEALSQVVKNNPDLVEIYLALGNLYRSQGDLERAVQIRNCLIVRPGLDKAFQARSWLELGRDYKRGGFLDRARNAFEEARKLSGQDKAIIHELAMLSADSGDYERCASYYAQLRHPVAQAHYLVRLAWKYVDAGDDAAAKKWLARALKVYPGSVEAWLATLERQLRVGQWKSFQTLFRNALDEVAPALTFLLPEGLLHPSRTALLPANVSPRSDPASSPDDLFSLKRLAELALPVIEERAKDILLTYYSGILLLRCHQQEAAVVWFERTLALGPDFWPARLELLDLSRASQPFSLDFTAQLEFFLTQARQVKRFFCRSCGLKREHIFFNCPRCRAWHSVGFRSVLHE